MISRSKTHAPDRSVLAAGEAAEGVGQERTPPKRLGRDDDGGVGYGYALSGSGESHRPETSVSSSDLMSTSCRHLICRASVPEEAVQRSGQRLMAMLVILDRCYGRYS